ncbi:MAG TPA: hypothetical protein VFH11_08015, partial [Gemmatimonadota bacterium]|nr:hypothetical protein [Gemmatimonadota bacterium]
DGIVRRARAESWSPPAVESALAVATVGRDSLVLVEVAGDPTARFRPGSRLTPECIDEIGYDEAGYSLFTPHVADNDPALAGPLVLARDLRDHNLVLVRAMPGRELWIYRRGRFSPWTPER